MDPRGARGAPEAGHSAPDKPGVDLGVLLGLVGTCGGHLWIEAEPSGNMILKSHLPKRVSDDATEPAAPGTRPERGLTPSRWFRNNPKSNSRSRARTHQ